MTMNAKKSRATREENSNLLIAYSGPDEGSGSESDNLRPLELPPTRLRRPKSSRKIRVGPPSKSCCSVWALCQVLFIIVVIGVTALMIYFTVVLKTSIDNMKSQVASLESYDRSSTKEFTTLNEDVTKKITGLRDEEAKKSVIDDKHYKSLIAQIAFLNKTLKAISLKAKSPKSVVSISKDIDQLKKGMADTGQEITAVKDTVTKLTKLAHLQNRMLTSLRQQLYNLSREVAVITGKPSPRAPTTGTPPIILRIPVDEPSKTTSSKSEPHATSQSYNVSLITAELKQVIKIVRKINGSFVGEAERLKKDLNGMKEAFENHTVKYVALEKQVKGLTANIPNPTTGANGSNKHASSPPDVGSAAGLRLGSQVHNLTRTVKKIADFLVSHQKKFSKVERDVAKMNKTVYRHHVRLEPQSRASSLCNCTKDSGAVKELWLNMSYEHQHVVSLQSKLVKLEQLTIKFIKASKGQPTSGEGIVSVEKIYPTTRPVENSVATEEEKKSGKKDLSQDIGLNVSVGSHSLNASEPAIGTEEWKSGQPTPTSNHTILTTNIGEESDLNSTVSSLETTPKPTASTTLDEDEKELESKLKSSR